MRDFQLLKKLVNGKVVVDKFSALPELRQINGETNKTYTSAGSQVTVKIDRNKLLKGIKLRVTVDVDNGAVPGAPTARENNPAEILQELQVKVNGKPVIGPMSGRIAFLLAQYLRGKEPLEHDKLTTAELAIGAGTPTAVVEIPLDFVMFGVAEPLAHAGAVYSPVLTDLELSWKWGATSDLMDTPGTHTILATSKVEVTVQYAEPDRRFVDAEGYGLFARNSVNAYTDFGTGKYTKQLQSGAIFRGLALLASGGATKRVSNAVFTGDVFLNVDKNPVFEDSAAAIQAQNARVLPTSFDNTGFLFLDPLKAGGSGDVLPSLEKMWRVPQLRALEFKADTTALGSGQVEFCPINYLPKAESLALIGAARAA